MSSPLEILDQQEAERAKELKKLAQTPCYDHTQCGEDCFTDCPHYAERKPDEKAKPAYTKEPWRVVSDSPVMAIYSEPENYRVVQTVNQNNFNTYGKSRVDFGIYKQEDADRIVACVNACAGITTEALNMGVVKGCMQQARSNSVIRKYVLGLPYEPDKWMGVPVYEEESK